VVFVQKLHRLRRNYEITLTDLLNVFDSIDVSRSGAVALADFEAAMMNLNYGPALAARIFRALDADGDGVLTMADWTSDESKAVALLITARLLRHALTGRNPLKAQRPPSSVRYACRKYRDYVTCGLYFLVASARPAGGCMSKASVQVETAFQLTRQRRIILIRLTTSGSHDRGSTIGGALDCLLLTRHSRGKTSTRWHPIGS
jgi:hypothetical protein